MTAEAIEKRMEESMKSTQTALEATFIPQSYKSFTGALDAFFEMECPQIGGLRTRRVLVNLIQDMVRTFYPETSHLGQGQIQWTTVDKKEKNSYGKSMGQTSLVSVVLDLIQTCDAMDRAKGKKLKDIKKSAVVRLCQQVDKQGGCITNAELAILLKISPATVGKYIKEWESGNKEVLPRRGTIHDIGPSMTHKKIIVEKLFLDFKNVQQVSRETYHSLGAIQRYIVTFKKVLICYRKKMTIEETCYAVGHTKRLVQQYLDIIEEYKERGCVLDSLENYEVDVETKFEEYVNKLKDEEKDV